MTEAEIIELERRRLNAMKRADAAALDELLDEDFEFFHGDGRYDNKASSIKLLTDGSLKYSLLQLNDPRAYVFGDTAVLFNTMDMDVELTNKSFRARRSVTTVWRQGPQGWKLVIYKGVDIPRD